jgi:hypothetical protein
VHGLLGETIGCVLFILSYLFKVTPVASDIGLDENINKILHSCGTRGNHGCAKIFGHLSSYKNIQHHSE